MELLTSFNTRASSTFCKLTALTYGVDDRPIRCTLCRIMHTVQSTLYRLASSEKVD